jgi:hypothetical protein
VQNAGKWDFLGIILLKKNLWTKSTNWWTAPTRSTMDGGHCHMRELTGAQPPAATVPESSDQGAGEEEGSTGDPIPGSPGRGRRRRDNGEGGGGGALDVFLLEAWTEGKEGWGRSGGRSRCWGALL